jgi:hypothetical protein
MLKFPKGNKDYKIIGWKLFGYLFDQSEIEQFDSSLLNINQKDMVLDAQDMTPISIAKVIADFNPSENELPFDCNLLEDEEDNLINDENTRGNYLPMRRNDIVSFSPNPH